MLRYHRLTRLRQIRTAAYGFLVAIVALLLFLWRLAENADFVASKWPVKPMPFEVWIFFGALLWLAIVAFWPELDKAEQPDVALVWDLQEDEKKLRKPMDTLYSKSILVHNRSDEWVYNVQIHPVKLDQEMTFEMINEIEPQKQHAALAHWDGRSSLLTDYVYFFAKEENERAAAEKKMIHKKVHNRGLSDEFLRIPMRVTYDANNRSWECEYVFIYDVGLESMFEKKSHRRV